MAVEELSNLLAWSNKFSDPLDGNKYRQALIHQTQKRVIKVVTRMGLIFSKKPFLVTEIIITLFWLGGLKHEYRIDGVFIEGRFISSMNGQEINFRHYPLFDTVHF